MHDNYFHFVNIINAGFSGKVPPVTGRGGDAYLNCPTTRGWFSAFVARRDIPSGRRTKLYVTSYNSIASETCNKHIVIYLLVQTLVYFDLHTNILT